MKEISMEAGLSQRYTNHCIRATTATILGHSGFAPRLICAVTGHKNEASLGHYINDVTVDQRREMSKILTSSSPKRQSPAPVATIQSPVENAPVATSQATVSTSQATVSTSQTTVSTNSLTSNVNSQQLHQFSALFSGANFYGTVNIQFGKWVNDHWTRDYSLQRVSLVWSYIFWLNCI